MKRILSIFSAALLVASATYAEEPSNELLKEAIEVDHFIVNWSPSEQTLGRVIVYRCQQCTPEVMTFDQNTELFFDEEPRPIAEIGSKTDWAGVITITNKEPNKIIKLRIN